MSGFVELIRATDDRLRREHDVDAGMEAVIESLASVADPDETVTMTRKLVRRRIRALHAATEQLANLNNQIEQMAGLLHLLPEGWDDRRASIEAALAANELTGLTAWLSDWYDAVSRQRWDAVDRLVGDVAMPASAQLLLERATIVRESLASGQWALARPLLEAGLDGLVLDGRRVPDEEVRGRLAALLARLSLANEPALDPTHLLHRAADLGSSTTAAALASRWHRLQGDLVESERWLGRVDEEDHNDLDVAVELIERARRQGKGPLAAEVAAASVGAVPLVSEVEAHLRALLYEPPPELWIATADRALQERDLATVDRALARGIEAAEWDDNASRARIAELRAMVAEERGDTAEQLTALIDAGSERLWSGAPDVGAAHFESALALEPNHTGAQLLLADSLLSSAAALPLRLAKPRLERALSLVTAAQARGDVRSSHAWSYATESYVRQSLLEDLDSSAAVQVWPALLASCRGLATDLTDWTRWLTFADALSAMSANELALDVSRHVTETLERDVGVRRLAAEKYANAGYPEEAIHSLEPLADFDEESRKWVDAVQGYCILRLGDPAEAARMLRSTELDPEWTWATESLVSALLLTGRMPEVMSEVAALERHWTGRLDERSAASSMAAVHLWQGRFDDAARLSERLADGSEDASSLLASARLLQGRHEEALALFERWLTTSATRRGLSEWEILTAPTIRVLAVHYGAPMADLQDLNRLAEDLLAGFTWPDPPASSGRVGRFRADPRDEAARLAIIMCDALIRFARGDAEGAIAGLLNEPLDERAGQLLDSLKPLAAAARVGPPQMGPSEPLYGPDELVEGVKAAERLAAGVVAAVRDGRRADAERMLEDLLRSTTPEDAGDELWMATDFDYEIYDETMAMVRSLVDHDTLSESADSAWHQMRRRLSLRVALPSSWFVDHEEPTKSHPIFVRYIPEARLRTPEMPGVRVTADVDLEPDGYQVLHGIKVLEEGRVGRTGVYATVESARLATGDMSSGTQDEVVPGIVTLPSSVSADVPGVLTSMSADEVVIRCAERMFVGLTTDDDIAVNHAASSDGTHAPAT